MSDGRTRWAAIANELRQNPELFQWIEREFPSVFPSLEAGLRTLAIEARQEEWRAEGSIGGRPEQLIPGTDGSFSDRADWFCWLLCGGRGSGKSRTGGEATREFLLNREWGENPRWALVGQTLSDVRINMVENTLLQILPPGSVLQWNRSTCELWLRNGAYLKGYSSDAPRLLRGPNFHGAWADELATWTDADRAPGAIDTTLSNLKMALRAQDGGRWVPRLIATTTPKAVKILRNPDPSDIQNPGPGLYDDPMTVISHMSTYANQDNLASHFIDGVVAPLKGTRIYEQEVLGKLMDEALGALWTAEQIEEIRVHPTVPELHGGGFMAKVLSIDPSVGKGLGDECGMIVAGKARDGRCYIIADRSMRGDPSAWTRAAAAICREFGVDAVVAEINQGGELVKGNLRRGGVMVPIHGVWARKNKRLRADPVAVLTDAKKVKLAGHFEKLERQMRTWDPENDRVSPDRLDAMVYAVSFLMPGTGAGLFSFARAS